MTCACAALGIERDGDYLLHLHLSDVYELARLVRGEDFVEELTGFLRERIEGSVVAEPSPRELAAVEAQMEAWRKRALRAEALLEDCRKGKP